MRITVSAALGAVCLFGISLYGQSYTASAEIPFSFHAARTVLPAGEYSLGSTNHQDVVLLTNKKTGWSMFLSTYPGERKSSVARNAIVFHRYGNECFLAEIWAPSRDSVRVPPTRREKELMLAPNPVAMVVVTIGIRAD